MVPKQIDEFIERFSRLPSVGPRLATRLAFHILGLGPFDRELLASALANLHALERCPRCHFFKSAGNRLCAICADPRRDPRKIALVEKETDIVALERTRKFDGHYLIVGALPENGVLESLHRERLGALGARIAAELGGKAAEIVVALNQTTFGDFVTGIVKMEFADKAEKITRLGRGVPTGGEIEFADEETLASALDRRV